VRRVLRDGVRDRITEADRKDVFGTGAEHSRRQLERQLHVHICAGSNDGSVEADRGERVERLRHQQQAVDGYWRREHRRVGPVATSVVDPAQAAIVECVAVQWAAN